MRKRELTTEWRKINTINFAIDAERGRRTLFVKQDRERKILKMRTFFHVGEHLFIATETLRQNLFEFGKFIVDNNEEPFFTRKRICCVTRQCLVALNLVHDLSLVHSDVKPENVLLSSCSLAKVKMIDFGSS